MTPSQTSACPECRLVLPVVQGPVDPYENSSPACWALFGEVMAREFSGPAFFSSHRLTVDAYMVQHQVPTSRASRQSLWVHLAGLCLMLERESDPKHVGRILGRLSAPKRDFATLRPPDVAPAVTVALLRNATDHDAHTSLARQWAQAVWGDWGAHHAAIRSLVVECESAP